MQRTECTHQRLPQAALPEDVRSMSLFTSKSLIYVNAAGRSFTWSVVLSKSTGVSNFRADQITPREMTMNTTLKFAFEKETKGAIRFQEVGDDGTPAFAPQVGTLYIRKSALPGGK